MTADHAGYQRFLPGFAMEFFEELRFFLAVVSSVVGDVFR